MIDPALEAYAARHSDPETELLAELAAETRAVRQDAVMMVGPIEGALLSTLARAIGARRALEIGTFTGYSALWLAGALPDDGELVTCDVDTVSTAIARRYWDRSPHGRKIRLELGPAIDTLARLDGPLDLAFIDADKPSYVAYWDAVVPRLRPGGLVIVDNVLWGGAVLDPKTPADHGVVALAERASSDPRVDRAMLTVRDGILLAVKR
jgi:caffeoyl-CoA O-methyltransferase